ncbi:MAG: recombination protein RecR [Caldiserica bacterium]|nr:recombination protein RecR [Caldisericota bacterium]
MYPQSFQELIQLLSRLPGLGPRSGERIAFHLLDNEEAGKLAGLIKEVKEKVHLCPSCNYLTEKEVCDICGNGRRNRTLLCIVEEPAQLEAIERTGVYKGLFYVLGGKISPWEGKDPSALPFSRLFTRLSQGEVKEVIIAVNEDFTALYIKKLLQKVPVKVTRLARGLPVGARIEYVDEATLLEALKNRSEI